VQVAEEEGVSFYRVDKASRARAARLEAGRTLDPPTRRGLHQTFRPELSREIHSG